MNIFFIPSWYPTADLPLPGSFIREHALALAAEIPQLRIGISLWGSHDHRLLLPAGEWYKFPHKLLSNKPPSGIETLAPNCLEFFTPAYSWTRKIFGGNIAGIVKANEHNFSEFSGRFGTPNLIHAYIAYPAGYVAMRLSEKYHVPYIISEQMSPFPMAGFGREGKLSHWIKDPYENAAAIITPSKALRTKMETENIRRLTVIPNFADENYFTPASLRSNEKFTFLFIARLEWQKGADILLQAFAQVCQTIPQPLELKIGGSGSEEKRLYQLADQLGIQNKLSWLGELSRESVKNEMDTCDTFVLPSRHESFGIVLAEAMAMGKPSIATICGGPEEILSSKTGLLVPPGNVQQLTEAMAAMVNGRHKYDAAVIRKEFLSRFSRKAFGENTFSLYEEILGTPSQ